MKIQKTQNRKEAGKMTNEEFHDCFVVFILTHGRADNVETYRTCRLRGYNGRIVLVIDDEDEQVKKYKERYGEENCYIFCKREYIQKSDEIARGDTRSALYARNACFDIARELGYRYFIELDDDYQGFSWKFDNNGRYKQRIMCNLDLVWRRMLEYMISVPCMVSICMAQGGDFIGGNDNKKTAAITPMRKTMNTFICDTERKFEFKGRINEDVNANLYGTFRGQLFLTLNQVMVNVEQTQANAGGVTEVYRELGTYQKSFMSVVISPSSVKLAMMGRKNMRLHHNVEWKYTAPMIVAEKWRKER